jgi:hypothetical protein
MGPQLGLVYSSTGGLGPFGLGWQLDTPAISRQTRNRIPRYRTPTPEDPGDTFVLAGAGELVERDSAVVDEGEGDWRITRYQPRLESGFQRIERINLLAAARPGGASAHPTM